MRKFAPRYWLTWLGIGFLRALEPLPYSWQLRVGRTLGRIARVLPLAHVRIARRNIDLCLPELSAAERPQEGGEPEQAKQKRAGNEPGERCHDASSRRMLLSLMALPVTAIEDADMATAASSGVTRPAMASGTNTRL